MDGQVSGGTEATAVEHSTGPAVEVAPLPQPAPDEARPAAAEGSEVPQHHPPTPESEAGPTVYRLRDLDRRGRRWAAVFAAALLLMPLLSFALLAPDWAPSGDPALMALRSLDVGTSRTPVIGQPSTSAVYVDEVPAVAHPGPVHFYLMALPVRLLGAAYGMLLVSLVITGGAVLVAAWAVFRQLGPSGGVVGAVILGVITFTTGPASLMHPVSSNIAGYPLLAATVLLWCLLAGDLRLLPLTAVVIAFAAQQHLSAGPTLLVAVAVVGAAVVLREWRLRHQRDPAARRQVLRWLGWSTVLGGALLAPMLLQQAFGDQGNLSALVDYAGHDERPTLGFDSAFEQLAHVLGVPPLLGQLEPTGHWLLGDVSVVRWASAALVLAATIAVGLRCRRTSRPRAALAAMAVILVVAGVVNGASVPVGIEVGRLPFYHWVWPLSLVVLLGLGLVVVAWGQRTALAAHAGVRPLVLALGVAAIAVPALVNPALDRRPNTVAATGSPVERHYIEELADEILAHDDRLRGPTVVLERGDGLFEGFGPALSLELIERGVDVRMVRWLGRDKFVHADRIADRDTLRSGLVLVVGDGVTGDVDEVPGERVAGVLTSDFDTEALSTVVEQLESADEVVMGDDLEQAIADLPEAYEVLVRELFADFPDNAFELLSSDLSALRLLRDYPLEQPALDPALLDRLIDSVRHEQTGYRLDVHVLDRAELLEFASRGEIG